MNESSIIRRKHKQKQSNNSKINKSKLRLDGIEKLNCSQSMKSVLNFHPEDVISNKKNTFRTKKSGVSSGTFIKVPGGYNPSNKMPLQYLHSSLKRLKNKRQFSENPNLRISEEMK